MPNWNVNTETFCPQRLADHYGVDRWKLVRESIAESDGKFRAFPTLHFPPEVLPDHA